MHELLEFVEAREVRGEDSAAPVDAGERRVLEGVKRGVAAAQAAKRSRLDPPPGPPPPAGGPGPSAPSGGTSVGDEVGLWMEILFV